MPSRSISDRPSRSIKVEKMLRQAEGGGMRPSARDELRTEGGWPAPKVNIVALVVVAVAMWALP